MSKRNRPAQAAADLRRRAVERIARQKGKNRIPPGADMAAVVHELEIHRAELEIQNEDLRQARLDVEREFERYSNLFDFAPIGYASLSVDGVIQSMNHAGAKLLGGSRARTKGKRFSLYVPAAYGEVYAEFWDQVVRTGQSLTCEMPLGSAEAGSRLVRITGTTVARPEPTVLLAFEDITAQKRAEASLLQADEALREADRRKDEFLALLSHELRTPLSTLLMHSQLLQQDGVDAAKAKRSGEAIQRAARVPARLIDDLLDVSRIIAGKLAMKMGTLDLVHVVQAATDAIVQEAKNKRIEMSVEMQGRVMVVGDAQRLQQATGNLLINALKYTQEGGRIWVKLASSGPQARIVVRDDGMGIDPAFLPRVFEKFAQSDRALTRGKGGLGLGLSLAQSIVNAHAGVIEAESPGRGKGSTFTISLPLAPQERVALHEPITPLRTANIEGARLLVVEDDPSTRSTLTQVLELAGAEVLEAQGAPAAMGVLNEFQPDVLVCHIALPDEDGCTLLGRIRARG